MERTVGGMEQKDSGEGHTAGEKAIGSVPREDITRKGRRAGSERY